MKNGYTRAAAIIDGSTEMGFLKKLWNDEEGATATEYAIIVAILGVSLVIILVTFRGSISGFFDNFAGEVAGSTE